MQIKKHGNLPERSTEPAVFTVTIRTRNNATWQGALSFGGENLEFASEIDLLLKMERLLEGNDPADGVNERRTSHEE